MYMFKFLSNRSKVNPFYKSASFVLALLFILIPLDPAFAQEVNTASSPNIEVSSIQGDFMTADDIGINQINIPELEATSPEVIAPDNQPINENDSIKDKETESAKEASPVEPEPEASNSLVMPVTEPEQQVLGKYVDPEVILTTGSLTYSYPITLPEGQNGLTPALSLAYDNGNRAQFSLVSPGWSLDIPYIQKINKFGSEHVYDEEFESFLSSFDGELIRVSATEFVPKVQKGKYLKYEFQGGVWTITDKDGTVYVLGSSTLSQQANSTSTEIYAWFVDTISDTNNNTISYSYQQDGRQIYPTEISYSDNLYSINFDWENKDNKYISFATNYLVETRKRLKSISVFFDENQIRQYDLAYTDDVLASVEMIGYDGTALSYPVTKFTHSGDSQPSWQTDDTIDFPEPLGSEDTGVRFGDLNGDGLIDIIRYYRYDDDNSSNNFTIRRVHLNEGGGNWDVDVDWDWDDIQVPFYFVSNSGAISSSYTYQDLGTRLIDVNGDGLDDMVVAYDCRTYINNESCPYSNQSWIPNEQTGVYINNGSGFTKDNSWTGLQNFVAYIYEDHQFQNNSREFVDINGDGLPDLVTAVSIYDDSATHPSQNVVSSVLINTGSNWVSSDFDFPASFSYPANSSGEVSFQDYGTRLLDVNGDGLTDVLRGYREHWYIGNPKPAYDEKTVYMNTGSGWATSTSWTLPVYFIINDLLSANQGYYMADVNGDRLSDIIRSHSHNGTYKEFYRNTGEGWVQESYELPFLLNSGAQGKSTGIALMDFDGDTMLDGWNLNFSTTGGAQGYGGHAIINMSDSHYNLTEIDNNVEGVISIAYDGFIATNQTNHDVVGTSTINSEVVTAITYDDGVNALFNDDFEYKNAYFYATTSDIRNRRFAGFGEVTKIRSDNSKVVEKYHQNNGNQDNEFDDSYAKIGKVYETVIYDDNDNLYSLVRNTFTDTSIATSATSSLQTSKLSMQYDGTSSHVDTAESWSYDTYGNILTNTQYGEVSGNVNGAFEDLINDKRTITKEYLYDTTDYVVSLPISVDIENGSSTSVAKVTYVYDSDGNLLETGRWIDGFNYATTTYTYDSYGHVTSETDPLSNTTTYIYDSNNLYPATVTNALLQDIEYTYDYSSGGITSITDENGNVAEYDYDPLDRLIEERKTYQNGGSEIVKEIAYNTTANPQYITTTLYRDAGDTQDVRRYIDGFGKVIQEKSEYEDGWATVDTVYDGLDRVVKKTLPYSTGSVNDSAPTTTQPLFTEYTYDPLNRVTEAETVRGSKLYTYDGFETLIEDEENNTKKFVEDSYGNLVEVHEFNSSSEYITSYAYDSLDRLVGIVDAEDNTRNLSYDGLGRRTQLQDLHASEDSTFGVWDFTHDAMNLISTTDPVGDITSYTYDELNRALTEDSDSTVATDITYVYDSCVNGIGKVCSVTTPDMSTAYTYWKQGLPATTTISINSNPYASHVTYNRQGQEIKKITPGNQIVVTEYNVAGLPKSVSLDSVVVATSTYAMHGKPIETTSSNSLITRYEYSENDLYSLNSKNTGGYVEVMEEHIVYSTTTATGTAHEAVFEDDFQGELGEWEESSELNWKKWYSHYTSQVPGHNDSNRLLYSEFCGAICVIDLVNPIDLMGAASTTLSFWRNLLSTIDNGEYLKVEVYDGSAWRQVAYWTNGAGDDGSWHYETINIQPYVNSNLDVRFIAKANTVGEVIQVDEVLIDTYLPVLSAATSTATSSAMVYIGSVQNLTYAYDSVGNITSIIDSSETETSKTQSFTYDDLYRLTSVTASDTASGTSAYTQSFTYSPIGNITNFNGTTFNYSDNGYNNPHAVTSVGGTTHAYSSNGNLINDGTWTHAWDYRNRLTGSSDGTNNLTYTYNQENARMKLVDGSDTTLYPFSDYQIKNGVPKLYLSLGDTAVATVEGATTTYIHTDHLGGTTITTDSTGFITQELDYYPFGDTRIDNQYGGHSQDRQFTGHIKDAETELLYMGARYYPGSAGRFISQDPANLDLGSQSWESKYERPTELFLRDPQQLNTYSYSRNNPIVNTDPGGDILPLALAIGYAGLMIYDAYDTANTLADSNSSISNKILAAGLFVSPVGEIKAAGKLSKEALQVAINRQKGQVGEMNAGITKNTEMIPSASNPGSNRIPDVLDHAGKVIGDVKNVNYQSFTSQLRDFADYAQKNSYQFVLYVDQRTQLSKTLERLGEQIKIIKKGLDGN